jgi:hypothetical protein
MCEPLAARGSNAHPDAIDDLTPLSGTTDLERLIDLAALDHYVGTEPGWRDLSQSASTGRSSQASPRAAQSRLTAAGPTPCKASNSDRSFGRSARLL